MDSDSGKEKDGKRLMAKAQRCLVTESKDSSQKYGVRSVWGDTEVMWVGEADG